MVPDLSRQQRRKLRRDLAERGRKALARGLPSPLGRDDALGITLVLHETLDDKTVIDRASRLAEVAEALLDRTMNQQTKGLSYACRKGCGWCCWQRVLATAPEIFRVAQWLRANVGRAGVPTLAQVLAADASDAGYVATAAPGNQRPCALLLDNSCSIHPGRPLPCRAVLSMSADACRDAMLDPTTAGPVPLVVSALDASEQVRTMMLAAISAAGLPDTGYDLVDGIVRVMEDQSAEARWLSGEDVLAGVRSVPRAGPGRNAQSQLADMLRQIAVE